MANDEKKQDLRSGVHRRLGDWLHMAMIACYMAVLFVQPAAAADDDMWTRFSEKNLFHLCITPAFDYVGHPC